MNVCDHHTSQTKQLIHISPCRALSLLNTLPPSTLDCPDVTKKILGDRPNTYTFTKVKSIIVDIKLYFSSQIISLILISFILGNGRAASARRGRWIAHLYCPTKHRCLNVEGTLWMREDKNVTYFDENIKKATIWRSQCQGGWITSTVPPDFFSSLASASCVLLSS